MHAKKQCLCLSTSPRKCGPKRLTVARPSHHSCRNLPSPPTNGSKDNRPSFSLRHVILLPVILLRFALLAPTFVFPGSGKLTRGKADTRGIRGQDGRRRGEEKRGDAQSTRTPGTNMKRHGSLLFGAYGSTLSREVTESAATRKSLIADRDWSHRGAMSSLITPKYRTLCHHVSQSKSGPRPFRIAS